VQGLAVLHPVFDPNGSTTENTEHTEKKERREEARRILDLATDQG